MKSKNKDFIEKIINFLLNILIFIFGIILLISIYTSFQTKVLNKDYTDFFGYSVFEVQTGSMKKEINPGDWIIVRLTNDVELNDVITYRLNNDYITHRVISVYNGTYTTKGDANSAKDDPISKNQIVGKVVNVFHNFGILRKTLFNPAVLIALIATLFLFSFAFKKNTNTIFLKIIKKVRLLLNNDKKSYQAKDINQEVILNPEIISSDTKKEDIPIKEDESLEKTSLYRVISIENQEVDEKYKAQEKEHIDEEVEDEIKEDELEKTSLYRVISVDSSEMDTTLLEIAENEIKKSNKSKETDETEDIPKIEETDEVKGDLTNIDFELLKNKKGIRKGTNIIDTAIIIKEEELNKLINILNTDNKKNDNKQIRSSFIKSYIDAKYYNIDNDSSKNYLSKIKKNILNTSVELKKVNTIQKSIDIIDIYYNLFILIISLDQAKASIKDLKVKKEFYIREISGFLNNSINGIDAMVEDVFKIQNMYENTINYFLEKLETNMFSLNFNKINSKKEMYALELKHSIQFSKVYSDYIIDKTYSEGIIAENKIEILLTLLSIQLIKDMISHKFDKEYVLYIPESIYSKEKKFYKLLKLLNDRYAKNSVFILVRFKDLLKNQAILKEVRTQGYKFALAFDREVSIKNSDRGNIYIADYILINKKLVNTDNILPFIPEEFFSNIIYEDIEEKVGGFGGE